MIELGRRLVGNRHGLFDRFSAGVGVHVGHGVSVAQGGQRRKGRVNRWLGGKRVSSASSNDILRSGMLVSRCPLDMWHYPNEWY